MSIELVDARERLSAPRVRARERAEAGMSALLGMASAGSGWDLVDYYWILQKAESRQGGAERADAAEILPKSVERLNEAIWKAIQRTSETGAGEGETVFHVARR